MDNNIRSIENKIHGVSKDVSKTNKKVELVRTEDEERKKREKNIIIRGVPESEDGKDKLLIETILCGIERGQDIPKIVHIDRLGSKKQSSQLQGAASAAPAVIASDTEEDSASERKPFCRPIRLKLEDVETKKNILKNAPKIREVNDSVTGILITKQYL